MMNNANLTEVTHLLTLDSHSNRITNQLASSDSMDMEINIRDEMTSLEHDSLFDLTQKIVQKVILKRTDVEALSRLISREQVQEVEDEKIFLCSLDDFAIGISLICAVIGNFFKSFPRNLCQLERFECPSIHRTLEKINKLRHSYKNWWKRGTFWGNTSFNLRFFSYFLLSHGSRKKFFDHRCNNFIAPEDHFSDFTRILLPQVC